MRNNMVRVISLHNFLKQDITSIDEVSGAAAVSPDYLFLVQPNNTLLVKNLNNINGPGYTIPTIDQAIKIVYSIQGNYIAALENKTTRNGTKVSYVRVYVNWETLEKSKESFPLRARIAGRVTPLSQSQQGLEMIEIPVHHMPDNISCCSISGNLLLSSRNVLSVYKFVTQVHDISKIHFIDFAQIGVDLHLSFLPVRHQLLENFIAVQNDEFLYVFQVKSSVPMCSLSDKEFSIDDFESVQSNQKPTTKKHKTINYEKLVKELEEMQFSLNWESTNAEKKSPEDFESELSKINLLSFPVRHEFPTIKLEKSVFDPRFPDVFRQNPFTPTTDLSVNLIANSSQSTSSKCQYKTVNICQYHLVPLTIGSVTSREMQEKFITLILRPYYSNESSDRVVKQRLLESDNYKSLKCVACFFGTQQEGYLHSFELENSGDQDIVTCKSYTTYAFTAPVTDIQLNDCFLYAVTEAGLETYTMRPAKHLLKRTDSEECPSSRDPVCLIGLHPFVNVQRSTIANDYLILFANNEESSWTLYQLKLPNTPAVWKDFLTAAEENKWEAPSTYCELLGEAHLILKTRLKTSKWTTCKDPARNQLSFAVIADEPEKRKELEFLYKESCALLGDYHILNKNCKSFYCYYTMSGMKIVDIIKRVRNLWNDIPEKHRNSYEEEELTNGLIYFLKKTLSVYDQKYYEFVGNREEFYSPEIGALVTNLMDLLEKGEKTSISDLVLESVVLREFSTDRILKLLKSLLNKSSAPQDKDALSLALMCLQRDQSEQAKTVLLTMSPDHLEILLLDYYDLLFANHSSTGTNMFTELSLILIDIYPNVLSAVLSNLVTVKKLLSLSKIIHFFMDLMPSGGVRSKNSSLVLQNVLETYFKFYAENFITKKFDHRATEAMKILIRIYLTRLQGNGVDEKEEDPSQILFYNFRMGFLSHMPPFGREFEQMFESQNNKPNREDLSKEQKSVLLKIQSLLSFDGLPEECAAEVRNFLTNQPNICGSLSLRVLSSFNTQEAINLLVDFAPQALTHFAKKRLKDKEEWKYLVGRVYEKMDEMSVEDTGKKFFFEQIVSDVLHHVAENLNIEDLVDILPKDYEQAERYLAIAQNNAQANHIKTLIMITGKQLLASL